MANVDKVKGFIPVSTVSGSPWQSAVQQYELSTTHLALGVGDLVTMAATGALNLFAAGDAQLMGVVVGVINHGASEVLGKKGDHFLSDSEPTRTGINSKSVPVDTAGTILVCTAPDVILEGSEDGDTDPLELADIGQNIEIIGGGPNATTGISDMYIDSSTHNTTATLPLRLLGLVQSPDNEYVSGGQAYTRWLVTPANHALSGINVGI
jgi:hypothetical protein